MKYLKKLLFLISLFIPACVWGASSTTYKFNPHTGSPDILTSIYPYVAYSSGNAQILVGTRTVVQSEDNLQNIFETRSSTGVLNAYITENGDFSNSGQQTESEEFGDGAKTNNTRCIAIGYNARAGSATLDNSIAVGYAALATGDNSFVFGSQSTDNTFSRCFVAGVTSSAGGADSVAIGESTLTSGANAIAIGASASAGLRSTVIGFDADDASGESICLGAAADSTAANQFVIGGNAREITSVWIGEGVSNASPLAVAMQNTAASGTNIAGVDFTISAGEGTGSADGGELIFRTAAAGTTGATAGTLTERFRIDDVACSFSNGLQLYSVADTVLQASTPTAVGQMYWNSTAAKIFVSTGTTKNGSYAASDDYTDGPW